MHFIVTVQGVTELVQMVHALSAVLRSETTMTEIALMLQHQILGRTAKGVDVNSNPFAAYSKQYARYRATYGHPIDKVNLFWYGTMLNSIDADVTATSAEMFVQPTHSPPYPRSATDATRDREAPNNALKAYYLQMSKKKPREFFAMAKTDVDGVVQLLGEKIDAVVGA